MEYLNRIVEADKKSKSIIEELSQTKGNSYKGLTSDVTFDEFNNNKEVILQDKLQDLETMIGYYDLLRYLIILRLIMLRKNSIDVLRI